jgi:hypothetical protein
LIDFNKNNKNNKSLVSNQLITLVLCEKADSQQANTQVLDKDEFFGTSNVCDSEINNKLETTQCFHQGENVPNPASKHY